MRNTWSILFALLICCSQSLCADTYRRQPGVDAQHYQFNIQLLTDSSQQIRAEARLTFKITQKNLRYLYVDLASSDSDGKGMNVETVNSEGIKVHFVHEHNRLQLPIPAGAFVGQLITYEIKYQGSPKNGLRIINNIHGELTAFSENWHNNARLWLPVIDHPYDKATCEFIITTKAEYQVVSNGALRDQTDLPGGLRRTHWVESTPISSWLYAMGVAHFLVKQGGTLNGTPLSYWVFPQDEQKGLKALQGEAQKAFAFFEEKIAPYPFEKLAHVQAAGISGATEHATTIFYGEDIVSAGNAPTIHETSHHWFGNSVTESDWNHVWLSEGFATYMALLYTEYAFGHDQFIKELKESYNTVRQFEIENPNTPVVHTNLNELTQSPLNPLVYEKGAWTLHMLRCLLGDDVFWKGMRLYYNAHKIGLATTDDFRQSMEQASGKNLKTFFHQWLYRGGIPTLNGSWYYDEKNKQLNVKIVQSQKTAIYQMPLTLGILQTGSPTQVLPVQLHDRLTKVQFHLDTKPSKLVFDPNVELLAEFGTLTEETAQP